MPINERVVQSAVVEKVKESTPAVSSHRPSLERAGQCRRVVNCRKLLYFGERVALSALAGGHDSEAQRCR